MEVGNILVSQWGYDQTNTDFFQIVKATAKSVWIRELKSVETVEGAEGMSGTCVPLPDQFEDWSLIDKENKAVQRLIKTNGILQYIDVKDYNEAYPWNGRPEHWSRWA